MSQPARDDEAHPAVTGREKILRDPLPTARGILWKPLPDSYHLLASMMRATEQQAVLFVTQRAFLQVERHLRSAPDLELGGFLAGQLFECPRTKVRYSVINTIVPFADVSSDALGSRVTQEAFDGARKRLDRHQLSLIGWYRNGRGLGLQLLPDDVETHLTYFEEPWQTTMLVVPDPGKPKGAFFTYDPRVGRSYCIPFYELFDSHAVEADRLGRTCVSWTTYVAAAPVSPLAVAEKEVVESTVVPLHKPVPEPPPVEPLDEWWDAIKDPWVRLKEVAVSATRPNEPSPLRSEPMRARSPVRPPPARPARPATIPARESPAPAEHDVVTAPAAAVMPMPNLALPPLVRPHAPPREIPPTPSVRMRSTPLAPRRGPTSPVAIAAAATGPAVALPPDFHDEGRRWQRRRHIGLAVAAASFLSVIVLSTLRSRTNRDAAPVAAAASQPGTDTSLTVAMNGSGPIEISMANAVDSLSGALGYYREIENDHREGLVGCRVLNRAYTLVDRARTRVDSTRRSIVGSLSDADSIRVSMLGAELTHVTQTYRRSGCR